MSFSLPASIQSKVSAQQMLPASLGGSICTFIPANVWLEMSRYYKILHKCSWSIKIPDRWFRVVSNELSVVTPVGVRSALILTITNCHEGHVCLRTQNNEVQQQKKGKKNRNGLLFWLCPWLEQRAAPAAELFAANYNSVTSVWAAGSLMLRDLGGPFVFARRTTC